MGKILEAKYPLEYVAFFHVKVRTLEGFAYIYMAVDAYTGYLFQLDIERDDNPESVLKNVYLLTENEEFKSRNTFGFTLVFDGNEAIAKRIEAIISPENGMVIFNKTYNNHISNPVLLSLLKYLKK